MAVGPDAARYLLAGNRELVARPFNLRWLLPAVCGTELRRWWIVWAMSWPVAAAGCAWWASGLVAGWQVPTATAVLLMALPGLWGPAVVRPVGVDLPGLAITMVAAGLWVHDMPIPALLVGLVAASVKESQPVWLALWVWSPWPLICLAVPLVAGLVRRPEVDRVTAQPQLRAVHDHPIRTAIAAHRGRWRDAWLLAAPWGASLAALYQIDYRTAVTVGVAHAQLLVATDTVRLVHTAAGPVVALAAAENIPTEWLPVVVLLGSVMWWRKPELI